MKLRNYKFNYISTVAFYFKGFKNYFYTLLGKIYQFEQICTRTYITL